MSYVSPLWADQMNKATIRNDTEYTRNEEAITEGS